MSYKKISLYPTLYEFKQQNYQCNNKQLKFTEWQRDDRWSLKEKKALINSIMKNIGLHKLIVATILPLSDSDLYIVDGGHRYRTIQSFCNNDFYITQGDYKLYYDKAEDTLESDEMRLEQFPDLHLQFHSYKLDFDIYDALSEEDAIYLFLMINQTDPLSVAEWLNASIHRVITYLRNEYNNSNSTLHIYLSTYCKKPDNHAYLNQLMPFLAAYHRFNKAIAAETTINDKMIINLFDLGEPANNKASKTFSKLQDFMKEITTDIWRFNADYLNNFLKSLEDTHDNLLGIWIEYKEDPTQTQHKMQVGDVLTGYVLNLMGYFGENKIDSTYASFNYFLKGKDSYKLASSEEKKTNRDRSQNTATTNTLEAAWRTAKNTLDNIESEIIEYAKTFSSNPRGQDNCYKRYKLIINY